MSSFSLRNPTSLLVFPLLIILSFFAYGEAGELSAYEVLQQYDFPIGILPIGVTGYELNRETGHFSVYLSGTCTFSVENSYQLEYKSTISGVLSTGRLRDLKGVSVKVFFFWLSIVEVVHVGNDLQFSVGIASANFPANNFDDRPRCGCGIVTSLTLPCPHIQSVLTDCKECFADRVTPLYVAIV